MDSTAVATGCYNAGFNCCQSLLAAFGPMLGLDQDTGAKLGCGFGAGMGFQGLTCGAVTGAYMVIGLKFGNTVAKDELKEESTFYHMRRFNERFTGLHGSLLCADLLNADVSTTRGMELVLENNLFRTKCPVLVADASRILEDIILNQKS